MPRGGSRNEENESDRSEILFLGPVPTINLTAAEIQSSYHQGVREHGSSRLGAARQG
jgi:hypothetical protein